MGGVTDPEMAVFMFGIEQRALELMEEGLKSDHIPGSVPVLGTPEYAFVQLAIWCGATALKEEVEKRAKYGG